MVDKSPRSRICTHETVVTLSVFIPVEENLEQLEMPTKKKKNNKKQKNNEKDQRLWHKSDIRRQDDSRKGEITR